MQTLFRIVEVSAGSIEVDGIDISTIGLSDLRKKIAIIPQDALLFNGTVRCVLSLSLRRLTLVELAELTSSPFLPPLLRLLLRLRIHSTNLDPFGEHGDAELYDALKRAWLVDRDQPMPVAGAPAAATPTSSRFTLDLVIEDEGQNLSVGERSLVSLARALVKDSKIIVLECVQSSSSSSPREQSFS